MTTRTSRSLQRTNERMLRKLTVAAPSPTVASATASTAAQAIDRIAEIHKKLARGDAEAAQSLAQQGINSSSTKGPASSSKTGTPSRTRKRAIVIAVGSATVVCLLLGMISVASFQGGHSVSGTVMLNQEPLPSVELAFQLKNGTGLPVIVTTGVKGEFNVGSLPAGEYAIYLKSTDESLSVPKKYQTAESTPFSLSLTKDRSDLRMLAVSEKKK